MFDLEKLLTDVFDPQPGETVAVLVDEPHGELEDNGDWRERRAMGEKWRAAFVRLGDRRGFTVRPLVRFPATGSHGAELPAQAREGERSVDLLRLLEDSSLAVALTEYSATAPLSVLARAHADFRAASRPGVLERMERSALAADYGLVARRCRKIFDRFDGAVLCDVVFSTGHRCWFDLRYRAAEMDDGFLPRDKKGDRIINLPSGETFSVPYEAEREGEPSWTAGSLPVMRGEELVVLQVAANRIQVVGGEGPEARSLRRFFDHDPARTNVAEVAFGVNGAALVTGNTLEDEKAGFHWAYGRSDHLGGVWGVDRFRSPGTVVHHDIVYAPGNPVQAVHATLLTADGRRREIIRDGAYVV